MSELKKISKNKEGIMNIQEEYDPDKVTTLERYDW